MRGKRCVTVSLCLVLAVALLIGNGRLITKTTLEYSEWYFSMQKKINYVYRLTDELNEEIEAISTGYKIPKHYSQQVFTALELNKFMQIKIKNKLNGENYSASLEFEKSTVDINTILEKRIELYLNSLVDIKIPIHLDELVELREELLDSLNLTIMPRDETIYDVRPVNEYSTLLRACATPLYFWLFIALILIGIGGMICYEKVISRIAAAIGGSFLLCGVIMNGITVYFRNIFMLKPIKFEYLIDELAYVSFDNLLDYSLILSKIMFILSVILIAASFGFKEYERVNNKG